MKRFFLIILLVCLIYVNVVTGQIEREYLKQAIGSREIALTIDDVPIADEVSGLKQIQDTTQQILSVLVKRKIPAIGFVNESKIYVKGEVDERINLLRMWLDAGLLLGNHTFSHIDLNNISLQEYKDNVIKGEVIFRQLIQEKGLKTNKFYFRYPYNHTGISKESKESFQEFLKLRDYEIAPFTIEHEDYIFANVYQKAIINNNLELAKQIRKAYLEHLDNKFDYYEKLSMELFGYEPKQIFLIHVSKINADCLDEMIEKLQKRGYHFITLEQALTDKAYQSKEEYVGKHGISWLYRWLISQGKQPNYKAEPDPPDFILKLYQDK